MSHPPHKITLKAPDFPVQPSGGSGRIIEVVIRANVAMLIQLL